MVVKISEALLQNCEGFMHEVELVKKINEYFADPKDRKQSLRPTLTLCDLSQLEPTDLFITDDDGNQVFSKSEINKIIKLLGYYDLTLANLVKHDYYDNRGNLVKACNLDYEDLDFDSPKASPEVEKAAEIDYEITKDYEPEILNN